MKRLAVPVGMQLCAAGRSVGADAPGSFAAVTVSGVPSLPVSFVPVPVPDSFVDGLQPGAGCGTRLPSRDMSASLLPVRGEIVNAFAHRDALP